MKKKILVVDDEADLRKTVAQFMELAGYQTIEAENGMQGLEMARSEQPDAIVTDLRMPILDGIGMLEKIRVSGSSVPVILITGFADVPSIKKAWDLGAFDFLDKPVDFTKLTGIIKNALKVGKWDRSSQESKVTVEVSLPNSVFNKLESLSKDSSVSETICNLIRKAS